jgi:hypothetical protein
MINPVSFFELSTAIDERFVRTQRILSLGMASSMIVLACVMYFLSGRLSQYGTPDFYLVNLMSAISAGLFVVEFSLAFLLSSNAFSNNVLGKIVRSGMPDLASLDVKQALMIFQKAQIMKLALMMSGAVIGCVTCILAIINGVLPVHSHYWLNLAPAVIFVSYTVTSLPSKESISTALRDKLRAHG